MEQQNKRMIIVQLHEFTKPHFTYIFKYFFFKVCLSHYDENNSLAKKRICVSFWLVIIHFWKQYIVVTELMFKARKTTYVQQDD